MTGDFVWPPDESLQSPPSSSNNNNNIKAEHSSRHIPRGINKGDMLALFYRHTKSPVIRDS